MAVNAHRKIAIPLLALMLLLTAAPPVRSEPPRIAGIYSNLRYIAESGDLLGMEILILAAPGSEGFQAVVQIAEGPAPRVRIVPLQVSGNRVTFTMPDDGPYGGLSFTGTVQRTGISGAWSDGAAPTDGSPEEKLKRGRSYWQ